MKMKEVTLKMREEIRNSYKNWEPRSNPYRYYDWSNIFTPIENNVWADIRYVGLPMYPQYPVGPYFLDFADPVKKIGIEVDGKEFHLDIEKDTARQTELERMGWKIIRIPGSRTFKSRRDYITENKEAEMEDEELHQHLAEFRQMCSEGILLEIKKDYYWI